jgi:hypothetical protein
MRIKMTRLAPHQLPASAGNAFSELWAHETSTVAELEKIVTRWRYNRRSDDMLRSPPPGPPLSSHEPLS